MNTTAHINEYLTSSPEITFFKCNYKRHTSFTKIVEYVDPIKKDNEYIFNVDNIKGHVVQNFYLKINRQGYNIKDIINTFKFKIGDNIIDEIDYDWIVLNQENAVFNKNINSKVVYLKLNFSSFFGNNQSYPKCSVFKSKLSIIINVQKNVDIQLGIDSCILETNEHNRFVNSNHEYLINQLHYKTYNINTFNQFNTIPLSFKNATTDVYFVCKVLDKFVNIVDQAQYKLNSTNDKNSIIIGFEDKNYFITDQSSSKYHDNLYQYHFSLTNYEASSIYQPHGHLDTKLYDKQYLNIKLDINELVPLAEKYRHMKNTYFNMLSIDTIVNILMNMVTIKVYWTEQNVVRIEQGKLSVMF
jgi:hypothetical protein